MANDLRQRQMFLGGIVEDNPLSSSATTLTSSSLAAMQVIDATMHLPIILDPDGVAGLPEIAYITAHALNATTCTILRAQEGTVARQHNKNTNWLHGPTVIDWTPVAALAKTAPTNAVGYQTVYPINITSADQDITLATCTITNAPAGKYLVQGSAFVWGTGSPGSIVLKANGNTVGTTDDPRSSTYTRRPLFGVYTHAGGDLILRLTAGGEGGTTQYGINADPRFLAQVMGVQITDSVTGGVTGVPVALSTTETRNQGGSGVAAPGATATLQTRSITLTKTQTLIVFGASMLNTPAVNAAGTFRVLRDGTEVAYFRWHNESPSSTCRFSVNAFGVMTLAAGTYAFTLTGNNDGGSGTSVTYEFSDLIVDVLDLSGVVVPAPIPLSVGISATNKPMSALPQTYPEGLSVMWANTADGWPTYGLIRTIRYGTDVSQVIESVVATTVQRRYANSGGNTWTAFA